MSLQRWLLLRPLFSLRTPQVRQDIHREDKRANTEQRSTRRPEICTTRLQMVVRLIRTRIGSFTCRTDLASRRCRPWPRAEKIGCWFGGRAALLYVTFTEVTCSVLPCMGVICVQVSTNVRASACLQRMQSSVANYQFRFRFTSPE
jgi:hypothetical protein